MTDQGWIGNVITAARPQAMAALLRNFRDLDAAEGVISDLSDVESAEVQRFDESDYRDDILRLLFVCCYQELRAAARFDADGAVDLLEKQERPSWDRRLIAEGLALIDKAIRHGRPGPHQVQAAIADLHARAPTFAKTVIAPDLDAGILVPAGGRKWEVALDIRLYRMRKHAHAKTNKIWSFLERRHN